jgi:formate hydrogenlyase subunit 6/NADH:ubiquinone oxidoreductase subunit I
MSYYISDDCISCGMCMGACYMEAIGPGVPFVIDTSKCILCGRCADACPAGAVKEKRNK